MKLSNEKIYTYALKLKEAFNDNSQKLPIKINFYLQKNKNTLDSLASEIETSRIEIIKNHGIMSETGEVNIPSENLEKASNEIADLLSLEQDVDIYTVNIDSFPEDLSLTTAQMDALMFMID